MVAKIGLLAIVGPTASGKTDLAIKIAKEFGGEIIAADSRTIYRGLDIGTAKPNPKEQAGIPHWGIDLVGPGQTFTVADFKIYANQKINDIQARGNLPILVGGSGLYVDAVLYDFNLAPTNPSLRAKLESLSIEQLQYKIRQTGLIMPENLHNKRYLIRTLERRKVNLSRKPLSEGAVVIGINPPKKVLKERVKARALLMVKNGVLQEVERGAKDYGWDSAAMTGGIYKVFKDVLGGRKTTNQGISDTILSDSHLAKKQMTWFKRNKDIHWFEDADSALNWFQQQVRGKL